MLGKDVIHLKDRNGKKAATLPFFSHCDFFVLLEFACMKQAVKDYLSYSRKEMIGVFSFVMLLTMMAIIPSLIPEPKNAFTEVDLNKSLDSLLKSAEDSSQLDKLAELKVRSPVGNESGTTRSYFAFDPNTISDDEWRRLGVKEKTIITINKYKARGGTFEKAEDLLKLYGLSDELKKALLPFVRIAKKEGTTQRGSEKELSNAANESELVKSRQGFRSPDVRNERSININEADSAQWESLPGIGGKLAMRIIKFRDRLGGFVSTDQISEVYGIQDSTFQRIKKQLTGGGNVKTISVNTDGERVLAQHPYIQFRLAKLIVKYRTEHGNFTRVDDLQALPGVQAGDLAKLKPYLSFR